MIIIEQYGIKLKRICHSDIEQIRYWRNHPSVMSKMAYREIITSEMQEKWFVSIDNKFNYYFLIEFEGKDIGLINCKNINIEESYGEGGIFVWDTALSYEFAPALASILLLNVSFNELKIFSKSVIHILKDNTNAIAFNKKLGYVLQPNQEKAENQCYVLTKEDFNKMFEKIKHTIEKRFLNTKLIIAGDVSDKNLPVINELILSYSN